MATLLITGTNRGIGLELVKQYLQRGDTVLATCREPQDTGELAELATANPELQIFPLDMSRDSSIVALAATIKQRAIDVLINNAGVYGPRDADFGNVNRADWEQVMGVNAMAPLLLTQSLRDSLRRGGDKKLIYVTSRMGSIDDNSSGGSYIYRSSKTALNCIVRSLSVDLAGAGFRVAAVHPGWVRTDMGGPHALIDVRTSVVGMMAVIDQLDRDRSGGFFNYDGTPIPW